MNVLTHEQARIIRSRIMKLRRDAYRPQPVPLTPDLEKAAAPPEGVEQDYYRLIKERTTALARETEQTLRGLLGRLAEAQEQEKKSQEIGRLSTDSDPPTPADFVRVLEALQRAVLLRHQEEIEDPETLQQLLPFGQRVEERATKATARILGIPRIDVFSPLAVSGDLQKWGTENVNLIQSIESRYLEEVRSVVEAGVRSGRQTRLLAKDIEARYGVSQSRARLIARDQVSKLNAQISRSRMEEVGVEDYIWRTAGDERVRDRHRELEGTFHSWDDPPIVDERSARREHPGGDYQCRCIAQPVLGDDAEEAPWEGVE